MKLSNKQSESLKKALKGKIFFLLVKPSLSRVRSPEDLRIIINQ